MAGISPQADGSVSNFVSTTFTPTPSMYFHHTVDPELATLNVQVLGPNLQFKLTHSRALSLISRSVIKKGLEMKVVGFLALVTTTNGNTNTTSTSSNQSTSGASEAGGSAKSNTQRLVVACAESGHGSSAHGDLLDVRSGILSNALWTRRVLSVAKIIDMGMGSPFDHGLGRGVFSGGHVEVKLAVHAVYLLLHVFGIVRGGFDHVRRRHLKQLREVRWENGMKPRFEIYFSRKNCGRCGGFVKRLSELTGIKIDLCWKDRLVVKEYEQRPISGGPSRRVELQQQQQQQNLVRDPQDYDLEDCNSNDDDASSDQTMGGMGDDEDEDEDEDVVPLDVIDLISLRDTPRAPSRAASHISISDPVDDYIDGLAYRVGQLSDDEEGAKGAIIEFAEKMRAMYAKRAAAANVSLRVELLFPPPIAEGNGMEPSRSTSARRIVLDDDDNCDDASVRNINRPLPATPVIELPA